MKIVFREVKLPSGATLKVAPASFGESKALYQAVLEEATKITFNSRIDMANLLKELFCFGFSSKKVESCLWTCFQRCTYNNGGGDLKIDADTFEPVASRDDYMTVCLEVAKENCAPFVKSLYAQFQEIMANLPENLK